MLALVANIVVADYSAVERVGKNVPYTTCCEELALSCREGLVIQSRCKAPIDAPSARS